MVMIVTNIMFIVFLIPSQHIFKYLLYSDLEFHQNCMFLLFLYNVGGLVSGKSMFVVLSTQLSSDVFPVNVIPKRQ